MHLLSSTAVERTSRRFVTRTCSVCEWRGQGVELVRKPVDCPWCHAPTRVVLEELLVPISAGKNPHATALSRVGASKGGKARAARLSAARRQAIARAAARARWRRR
jgi:hypothetical protein